jgi:hypothetical protein
VNGISFFIDDNIVTAADFDLYTDASSTIGFGGYFLSKWFQGKWRKLVIDESFSIAYIELYTIVIAAVLWGSDVYRQGVYIKLFIRLIAIDALTNF